MDIFYLAIQIIELFILLIIRINLQGLNSLQMRTGSSVQFSRKINILCVVALQSSIKETSLYILYVFQHCQTTQNGSLIMLSMLLLMSEVKKRLKSRGAPAQSNTDVTDSDTGASDLCFQSFPLVARSPSSVNL